VLWVGLSSTIGGPIRGPLMYGMGLAIYPTMLGFQLPLPQATALPLRPNQEAATIVKEDFNTTRLISKRKGDLQQSTSHGTNRQTPSKRQSIKHSSTRG
jgi:hypothetical protein